VDENGRPQCWAKKGSTGKRCTNRPIAGTNVCRFHGGKSPQARRLATVRDGYIRATAVVRKLNLDTAVKKDPREVLLEQVYTAAAMSQAMRAEMGDVDLDALMDPDDDGHAEAQMKHKLFAEWQEKSAKTAKMALDIGIDEQMVKLAEMQAKVMANALKSVLMASVLSLTPEQQRTAQKLLGQELRRLVPDVANTPTETIVVDGEALPYNPAMDAMMANLGAPTAAAGQEYRTARKAELREKSRLGTLE
jgi:hypothetical protein